MHKVSLGYLTLVEQESENERLGQIWNLEHFCRVHLYIFKGLGEKAVPRGRGSK